MSKVAATDGIWKGFGLVRDKDGRPKIDNPETLPEECRAMLTEEEYFDIYHTKRK